MAINENLTLITAIEARDRSDEINETITMNDIMKLVNVANKKGEYEVYLKDYIISTYNIEKLDWLGYILVYNTNNSKNIISINFKDIFKKEIEALLG